MSDLWPRSINLKYEFNRVADGVTQVTGRDGDETPVQVWILAELFNPASERRLRIEPGLPPTEAMDKNVTELPPVREIVP